MPTKNPTCPLRLRQLAPNVTCVERSEVRSPRSEDPRLAPRTSYLELWFSYETPVGLVYTEGSGLLVRVKPDVRYSRTTACHMSRHLADFQEVTEVEFGRLLSEVLG